MGKEFGCLGGEPKTKPFEFQQGTNEGMEEAGDSFHLGDAREDALTHGDGTQVTRSNSCSHGSACHWYEICGACAQPLQCSLDAREK